MFACTLLSMHFLNSWISVILNQAGLSEVQTAFTNAALHWGGTVAAVVTVFLLGRLGLNWALILLTLGFAGCLIIATTGFASAPLLTLAVCMAGFGIVGCQGVLNTSAGLIYPVSCRPDWRGSGAGHRAHRLTERPAGRCMGAGRSTGPARACSSCRCCRWPSLHAATLVLILRGVDIRREAGSRSLSG